MGRNFEEISAISANTARIENLMNFLNLVFLFSKLRPSMPIQYILAEMALTKSVTTNYPHLFLTVKKFVLIIK